MFFSRFHYISFCKRNCMGKSNEKWLWLPDWASDLSLWQDDLTEVESSAGHTFVPYEEMVDNLDDLYKVSGLSKADVVVGWGMGAFLLLMNHDKKPAAQRWILLSPYADFCDEDSDWTETNLHFMARQMQTTTEPGLNSFAEPMAMSTRISRPSRFLSARSANTSTRAVRLRSGVSVRTRAPRRADRQPLRSNTTATRSSVWISVRNSDSCLVSILIPIRILGVEPSAMRSLRSRPLKSKQ